LFLPFLVRNAKERRRGREGVCVKVKEGTTFGKFGVIPPTHFLPESQKKEVGRRGVKVKEGTTVVKTQKKEWGPSAKGKGWYDFCVQDRTN
jgi:hypothetical protein